MAAPGAIAVLNGEGPAGGRGCGCCNCAVCTGCSCGAVDGFSALPGCGLAWACCCAGCCAGVAGGAGRAGAPGGCVFSKRRNVSLFGTGLRDWAVRFGSDM